MTTHNVPRDHARHSCDDTKCPTCSQGGLPGWALSLYAPEQEHKGASLGLKRALTSHSHSPGLIHSLQSVEDGGWRLEDGGWSLEDAALVVRAGRGRGRVWVCS